jgi:hypothetical protein
MLGREVSDLINETKQPGFYEIEFDASSLPSGTYFYRIESGNFTAAKKLMLVK